MRLALAVPMLVAPMLAIPALAAAADLATDQVVQPVNDLHTALRQAMQAGQATPFTARFDALAPVVEQVYDLDTVINTSVGLRWSSFDPTTQTRLAKAFHRFTVATYVANFDKDDGERFNVSPDLRASGADRIVRTDVVANGTPDLRLDYVMRPFGTRASLWRIVDVLIDGSISRVAVQRSDFRSILADGGAEALIASLRRKAFDLSDGALSA